MPRCPTKPSRSEIVGRAGWAARAAWRTFRRPGPCYIAEYREKSSAVRSIRGGRMRNAQQRGRRWSTRVTRRAPTGRLPGRKKHTGEPKGKVHEVGGSLRPAGPASHSTGTAPDATTATRRESSSAFLPREGGQTGITRAGNPDKPVTVPAPEKKERTPGLGAGNRRTDLLLRGSPVHAVRARTQPGVVRGDQLEAPRPGPKRTAPGCPRCNRTGFRTSARGSLRGRPAQDPQRLHRAR